MFICKTKASVVTQSNVEVHCRQRLSRFLAASTALGVGQILFLGSPTTQLANLMQFFLIVISFVKLHYYLIRVKNLIISTYFVFFFPLFLF